jgi:hypothetical protein
VEPPRKSLSTTRRYIKLIRNQTEMAMESLARSKNE